MFFNPGEISQNYYEYFPDAKIAWKNAKKGAERKILYGQQGHLATIRSKEENDFIANKTTAQNIWIGATDESKESEWLWSGGPDDGILFWNVKGSNSANSVNNEFAEWQPTAEPNNNNSEEHWAVTNWSGSKGKWNDLPQQVDSVMGFIVEYEQPENGWAGEQQIKLKQQTASSFEVNGFTNINLFGDQTVSGTIVVSDPEGLSQSEGVVDINDEPKFGQLNYNKESKVWNYAYQATGADDEYPDSDLFEISIVDDADFETT